MSSLLYKSVFYIGLYFMSINLTDTHKNNGYLFLLTNMIMWYIKYLKRGDGENKKVTQRDYCLNLRSLVKHMNTKIYKNYVNVKTS